LGAWPIINSRPDLERMLGSQFAGLVVEAITETLQAEDLEKQPEFQPSEQRAPSGRRFMFKHILA
jgi:hypothetical protein